jgi:phosphoglycolate phosphatase-like HAD superfamily hydrolase
MRAEECLMVGDTIEDADAAFHTGMRFCLMTHGYGDVPMDRAFPWRFGATTFLNLYGVLRRSSSVDR